MEFICRYCNKKCLNANSLRNHERLCLKNPNHQTTVFQTNNPQKINAWNKGLSASTDIRLKNLGNSVKNYYKTHKGTQTGRPRTDAEKQKISNTARLNGKSGGLRHGAGRGHKGIYKGYYCDSTYELAYIAYNLDHGIAFERCPKTIYYTYEYKGRFYKYYPDFILPDNSLVEIKGYHSEIVDLKIAAVNNRSIKVLYEKDLQYAFDYLFKTYKINRLEELYTLEDELVAAY